jgi:DNA-binding CsgD family transcriptional regulator
VEYWNSVSAYSGTAVDAAAACRLLSAIGSGDHTTLANALLDLVHPHVSVANCAVMGFASNRSPRIISVSSHSHSAQIFNCASNYVRQLFQHDRIQLHLQSLLPHQEIGCVTVHRQTLTQIIDVELRRLYNDTLGIADSMAITIKTGHREWITTHLCKHRDQGLFCKDDIETVLQLAALIASSASNHCRLDALSEGDFPASVNDGIDQLCSQLTQRERQVILRILDGVTVEQIAGELGLKPTTVITYRSRAYEKLGISSRRELFSAVLRKRKGSVPWQAAVIADNHPRLNGPDYAASTTADRPHQ